MGPTSQDQNTERVALTSVHLLSNGSVRSEQRFSESSIERIYSALSTSPVAQILPNG